MKWRSDAQSSMKAPRTGTRKFGDWLAYTQNKWANTDLVSLLHQIEGIYYYYALWFNASPSASQFSDTDTIFGGRHNDQSMRRKVKLGRVFEKSVPTVVIVRRMAFVVNHNIWNQKLAGWTGSTSYQEECEDRRRWWSKIEVEMMIIRRMNE